MMQVLKLYDPARKPTEWTGLVHAGQFAVFHSDVATDVERSPACVSSIGAKAEPRSAAQLEKSKHSRESSRINTNKIFLTVRFAFFA